jgi:hypothetical protein
VFRLKCLLFLSDFIFLDNFLKIHKCQFSWKSVQWEPSCSRRTDGWTDRHEEANCGNSQFGERAEIYLCHPSPCDFKFHQNSSNKKLWFSICHRKVFDDAEICTISLSQLKTMSVGYLTTLSVTQVIVSKGRMIHEWYCKVHYKNGSCPDAGTIAESAWSNA